MDGRPKVLGLDAAAEQSGAALMQGRELLESTLIKTKPGHLDQRLLFIYGRSRELLREWKPALVVIEIPAYWTRQRTNSAHSADVMAMARGAMLTACAAEHVSVREVSVQDLRKGVIGTLPRRGVDIKREVIHWLMRQGYRVPANDRNEPYHDIADAMVAAIWGVMWLDRRGGNAEQPPKQRKPVQRRFAVNV